ncbi:MAG TPA: OsmC family protein [Solirubrobacterales bacterium]|nr:OsmC family protein [Solirubrobacterales bacterium]
MKVLARRIEGFAHEIDLEGGHELLVDEPADRGGTDTGPRPTQLLATSLAGCTAITIEMYADRKGWDVGRLEVEVEMGYADTVPNSFDVTIALPAELNDEQRRRLLVIATKCPVHKVLAGEATVTVTERVETA